jgi:hypothetical protein
VTTLRQSKAPEPEAAAFSASREVAVAPREAAALREATVRKAAEKFGSLTAGVFFLTGARVLRRGVTHFIPGILFVSADIAQPLPKILFIVSADVIQPIPIIFCIG